MSDEPRAPRNVLRMIPNGEPVSMGDVTLGDRYGPEDFARDCGCEDCQQFLEECERRRQSPRERHLGPYTDMISEVVVGDYPGSTGGYTLDGPPFRPLNGPVTSRAAERGETWWPITKSDGLTVTAKRWPSDDAE
jgi:hypothetical protein